MAEVFESVEGHVVCVVEVMRAVPGRAADSDDVVVVEQPVDVLKGMVALVRMFEENSLDAPVTQIR